MKKRMNFAVIAPEAYSTIMAMEKYIATTELEKNHKELIKIRASQINGCSYCINMHTKDARRNGETEQRIYALSAWKDTPYFTKDEQAVLALTEEVTLISHNHVSDKTYDEAVTLLGEIYVSSVIMMIITVNCWNRMAITTGLMPE